MQNNNNHSKEKIAVFGAGGFIGSHMIEALTQTNYEVLAIDVNLEKLDEVLPDKTNVTTIELDITKDREEVEIIIKDSDVIVDLIAYANPSIYITDPIGTVTLDLFENLWITELCVKHKKFLFQYSTCEVYGLDNGRNQPFNEDESLVSCWPNQRTPLDLQLRQTDARTHRACLRHKRRPGLHHHPPLQLCRATH